MNPIDKARLLAMARPEIAKIQAKRIEHPEVEGVAYRYTGRGRRRPIKPKKVRS